MADDGLFNAGQRDVLNVKALYGHAAANADAVLRTNQAAQRIASIIVHEGQHRADELAGLLPRLKVSDLGRFIGERRAWFREVSFMLARGYKPQYHELLRQYKEEGQKGTFYFVSYFRGRPRGRRVDSRPRRFAARRVQ